MSKSVSREPGMWINVRFTEHRLHFWASNIKVHNRWLNFNSLTSRPSFIARWTYRLTRTVVHAVMRGETEHSIHSTVASWKLKASPTACAMSHLTHLAWENVTTNITRGRWVCSYRTLRRRLAAVQQTRRLAEVRWHVTNDLVVSEAVCAPWVGQTWRNLWHHNRQELNLTFSHTVPSTSTPAWRTSVNQSSKQNKYL